ncbi:MAG: VanZ family protein [Alphaproteobacteria bacterium]|nr:VanZ family protein [Alphaproteobacteria bacterium]
MSAWASIAILAVLSLLPANELLRTDLARFQFGKQGEHFIAYFGAATLVGMAYRSRLSQIAVALLLIPYAGLLEIAQRYSPGRSVSVWDFAASAAGVAAAALLMPVAWRCLVKAVALSSIAIRPYRRR